MCVPAAQICGDSICPLYTFCDSSSGRCIPETCAHRQAVWCPHHAGALVAQACEAHARCLGTESEGFVCKFAETGLLVSTCDHRVSVGLAAALQDPEQARLAGCCSAPADSDAHTSSSSSSNGEDGVDSSAFFDLADEAEVHQAISMHSMVGSMNNAVLDAEPELPGLQYVMYEDGFDASAFEQQWQEEDNLQQQQQEPSADGLPKLPDSTKETDQPQQQGKPPKDKTRPEQQRGLLKPQPVASGSGSSSGSTSRWSLGKLGSGLFRRAGRSLQQTIFPEGMAKFSMEHLYPGLATSSDPNTPFGTGRMGQFMTGLLSNAMNSGGMMNVIGGLVGPSMGGPVPTGKFTPVTNTMGNVVNTGSGPGGLMVRQGPGGVTTGVYGGGWTGPYNVQTGQYGMGGNYGFASPYHGRVQGTAMVTVPSWVSPNSPSVTYPCPANMGNGTIISPGVPCGIAITAIPARLLPTRDGLPAAVDISTLAVGATWVLSGFWGNEQALLQALWACVVFSSQH